MVLDMRTSAIRIQQQEVLMQQPKLYLPIANELALFCQSFGKEFSTQDAGYIQKEWLPDSVQQLPVEFCTLESNSIEITCGGGFYHFGYSLRKDTNTDLKDDAIWHLNLVREEQPEIALTAVHLSKSAKLTFDIFISVALKHYADSLAQKPRDQNLNQQQLFFCLKFVSRVEAIKRLHAAINAAPDYWWPRFALDLVESSSTDISQQDHFGTWVESNPSFSHYGYLVWLCRLENKPPEAAQAAEMMLKFPPSDDPDDINNFYARSFWIATYFYQLHQYDVAERICDKIIPHFKDAGGLGTGSLAENFKSLKADCESGNEPSSSKLLAAVRDQDEWTRSILGLNTFQSFYQSKP